MMEVDKEFAEIFHHTQMISSRYSSKASGLKGNSYQLLQKAIIKKENERKCEEEEKNRESVNPVSELEEAIKKLREVSNQKNQQIEDIERDSEILKDLYAKGIIDLEWNCIER